MRNKSILWTIAYIKIASPSLSQSNQDLLVFDLTPFLDAYNSLFLEDVRNNIYLTTKTLREYHYQKQKKIRSIILKLLIYRFHS